VTLKDGRLLRKLDCFIEAVEFDPLCYLSLYNLASALSRTEVVTLKDGRQVTKLNCYILFHLIPCVSRN